MQVSKKTFFYVLFCKNHPFGTKFVARDYTFHIDEECACKNGLSHEVCGFCFSVRYLLNLKCYKIFVEEYQIILWIKLFLWILI